MQVSGGVNLDRDDHKDAQILFLDVPFDRLRQRSFSELVKEQGVQNGGDSGAHGANLQIIVLVVSDEDASQAKGEFALNAELGIVQVLPVSSAVVAVLGQEFVRI